MSCNLELNISRNDEHFLVQMIIKNDSIKIDCGKTLMLREWVFDEEVSDDLDARTNFFSRFYDLLENKEDCEEDYDENCEDRDENYNTYFSEELPLIKRTVDGIELHFNCKYEPSVVTVNLCPSAVQNFKQVIDNARKVTEELVRSQ